MSSSLSNQDIEKCVKELFSTEEYNEITVEVNEGSKNNMHFGAFLKFVKVLTTDRNNQTEEHYLVVKLGKSKIDVEKEGPPRESYFFEAVLPLLLNFQEGMKLQSSFSQIAKCYKTSTTFGVETLILENLCQRGYEVLRGKNINDHNIRLVLKTVAQFHALSFAASIMSPKKFESVTTKYDSIMLHFVKNFTDVIKHRFNKIKECFKNYGKLDLLQKFDDLLKKYNEETLLNILQEKVEQSVILHGDLHNLNILFKYEKEDDVNASDIMLIDFQISAHHSPILDLSYYFTNALTSETYPNIFDYLKHYHLEFSSYLHQIHGMDVEELFPFSVLLDHWRRYSFYGFAFIALTLPIAFVAKVGGFEQVTEQNTTNTESDVTTTATSSENLDASGSKTESCTPELSSEDALKQRMDALRNTFINENIEGSKEYQEALMKLTESYLIYGMKI